jgi:hypothetical protein
VTEVRRPVIGGRLGTGFSGDDVVRRCSAHRPPVIQYVVEEAIDRG